MQGSDLCHHVFLSDLCHKFWTLCDSKNTWPCENSSDNVVAIRVRFSLM